MDGKGVFVWQTSRVENGDLNKMVALCRDLGIERVELKTTNGTQRFGYLGRNRNVTIEIVQAFRNAGISVYGWGFNYGNLPVLEGQIAAQEAIALGLDGHILNGEGAFLDNAWVHGAGEKVVSGFKQVAPNLPLGFCSFALYTNPATKKQIHPLPVLQRLALLCNFGMPECYWFDNHGIPIYTDPFDLTVEAIRQWQGAGFTNVIPVGRAYYGEGGKADPVSMMAFHEAVTVSRVRGYSLWSLQHIREDTRKIVSEFPLMGHPVRPTGSTEERLAKLEERTLRIEDHLGI